MTKGTLNSRIIVGYCCTNFDKFAKNIPDVQHLGIFCLAIQQSFQIVLFVCSDEPCQTPEGTSGTCVPYYLCNTENNTIISDGTGIIDIRLAIQVVRLKKDGQNIMKRLSSRRAIWPSKAFPNMAVGIPCLSIYREKEYTNPKGGDSGHHSE